MTKLFEARGYDYDLGFSCDSNNEYDYDHDYDYNYDSDFLEDTYLGCGFRKTSNDSYNEYKESLEY